MLQIFSLFLSKLLSIYGTLYTVATAIYICHHYSYTQNLMLGGTFELGEYGSTNLPVRIFQLNHNFCNSMTAKLTAALEEWWRSECSRAEIDILAEITRFYHGNL